MTVVDKPSAGHRSLLGATVLGGATAGFLAANQPWVALVIASLVVLWLLASQPRAIVTIWLIAVTFTPTWLGLIVGPVYLVPATLVGVPCLLLLSRRVVSSTFSPVDLYMVALTGLAIMAARSYGAPFYAIKEILTVWIVAYAIGRLSASNIKPVFSWLILACAVWSLLEFVTGLHPFVNLAGQSEAENAWASIQTRGPFSRSEGAFGHSIAFGAAFALALPFVYRHFRHPTPPTLLLAAGVLATLSRAAIIAFALTWALQIVSDHKRRLGARGLGALVTLLVIASSLLTYLDTTRAGEHFDASTAYRVLTVTRTLESINLLGLADRAIVNPETGSLEFSGIYSVDNALLFLALEFGAIFAIALFSLLIFVSVRAIARNPGPAHIAIAGQWPLLVSVALITQWQALFFFTLGMAVTETSRRHAVASASSGYGRRTSDRGNREHAAQPGLNQQYSEKR